MVERLISFTLKLKGMVGPLTDENIAKQTQTSVRTTQRYLRELRQAGIIQTSTKRYNFPGGGWSNYRIITWRNS